MFISRSLSVCSADSSFTDLGLLGKKTLEFPFRSVARLFPKLMVFVLGSKMLLHSASSISSSSSRSSSICLHSLSPRRIRRAISSFLGSSVSPMRSHLIFITHPSTSVSNSSSLRFLRRQNLGPSLRSSRSSSLIAMGPSFPSTNTGFFISSHLTSFSSSKISGSPIISLISSVMLSKTSSCLFLPNFLTKCFTLLEFLCFSFFL